MNLLKFSKNKLHIQALISENRELRDREHSAKEQLNLSIQKQKQIEDECERKLQELQSELVSCYEHQKKIQRQMNFLQSDNVLLEKKQNELQGTVQNLLQSREAFINAYEEHTCEMKRSLETKDKRLALLSEKIICQSRLFDSIAREASSVKQAMDSIRCAVSEKEQVATELSRKMDKAFAFEKVFIEKNKELEVSLKNNAEELCRKNRVICGLEAELEMEKNMKKWHPQLEELQNTLLEKDTMMQNLASKKEESALGVSKLEEMMEKIHQSVLHMINEDKTTFCSEAKAQEANK